MGYHTDFDGFFRLDKPLKPEHLKYLTDFSETRRMKRDSAKTELLPDPVRNAANLPVGKEGAYFVGSASETGGSFRGQSRTSDILDYNRAPVGQPGLWCQWIPDAQGNRIEWDGGEKFYSYVEWIEYLIDNFLKPWGYVLSGEVEWSGEDREDIGKICISNNVVEVLVGRIIYK